jgi:hypothetical protein
MDYAVEARKLANYIRELSFSIDYPMYKNEAYTHIGALYTNVVLQAGLNYKTVVQPRVERVELCYPRAYCLSGFIKTIEEETLETILSWKHAEKLGRMNSLLEFSVKHNIETCKDLASYLSNELNHGAFLEIRGFGHKTLDYARKLLSFDTIAVDRHIFMFVELAGVPVGDYSSTKNVVEFAADLLEVSRASIDFAIWNYMSQKSSQQRAITF